jgi:hypothetical protein
MAQTVEVNCMYISNVLFSASPRNRMVHMSLIKVCTTDTGPRPSKTSAAAAADQCQVAFN